MGLHSRQHSYNQVLGEQLQAESAGVAAGGPAQQAAQLPLSAG